MRELFATLDCRLQDGFAVAERRCRASTRAEGGPREGRVPEPLAAALSAVPGGRHRHGRTTRPVPAPNTGGHFAACCGDSGRRAFAALRSHLLAATGRTYVFVVEKAATGGDPSGGNWGTDLRDAELPLQIDFAEAVRDVIDERTGKRLGDGRSFQVRFPTWEAVLLSFQR